MKVRTKSDRERAWWNQLRCGGARERTDAALSLGGLLEARGEAEAAADLYGKAGRGVGPALAAEAELRLGQLLMRRDLLGPAAAAFDRAAELARPEECPEVMLDLAARWVTLGDIKRAELAYEAILEYAGLEPVKALAAYRLGHLRLEGCDFLAAVFAWEQALQGADADLRPHVLSDLAERLIGLGNADQSVRAYLAEVIESDHPDLAPRAALMLARVEEDEGAGLEAYRLAQMVLASEHPDYALEAEELVDRISVQELDLIISISEDCASTQLRLIADCELEPFGAGEHDGSHPPGDELGFWGEITLQPPCSDLFAWGIAGARYLEPWPEGIRARVVEVEGSSVTCFGHLGESFFADDQDWLGPVVERDDYRSCDALLWSMSRMAIAHRLRCEGLSAEEWIENATRVDICEQKPRLCRGRKQGARYPEPLLEPPQGVELDCAVAPFRLEALES